MPHDDLIELAQTGQLLDSDEVRQGPDGDWSAVRDRPGLLDCLTPVSPAEIPDDEPQPSDSGGSTPVAAISEDAAVAQESALSSPQPHAIPVAQSLAEFEVVAGQSSQTCEIPESSGTDVASSDELDFELNLPEPSPADAADSVSNPEAAKRTTEPKPIPDQTNELDFELNLPPQPPAAPAETAGPASFTNPPPLPPRANPRASSFEIEPPEHQEAPSPDDMPAPPIASVLPHPPSTAGGAEQTAAVDLDDSEPATWRRVTWPRVPRFVSLAGAAAFILCLVWWLLPGPERDIYADYVAIYQELQDRQSTPDGQTGWSEFADQSRARIDETNPWLEETAQPGDRAKNLLLYIGRDLQQMLEKSPDTASTHQRRLDGFFAQLAEIYEPSP